MTISLTLPTPRPLAGRRIVVTHPVDREDAVSTRLIGLGADVVPAPSIAYSFTPPDEASPLDAHLERLADYDWLIFTSATAVQAVVDRPVWAASSASSASTASSVSSDVATAANRPRVAVVGLATAAACRRAGIGVDVVAADGTALSLVEALRATVMTSNPSDGDAVPTPTPIAATTPPRALFPRANIARPDLADGLRAAGWQVDDVEAYRTSGVAPGPDVAAAFAAGVDAVTFTSPSAVRALVDGLDEAARRALAGAAIVCIGPTTAEAAEAAGLAVAGVARNRSAEGLVVAVLHALSGRRSNEGRTR